MSETPTVLITGAAGGLGRAVVKKFFGEGWRVVAADMRKTGFDAGTKNLLPVKLDVTDVEQVASARDRVKTEYGRLDVLVNAAGILDFFPLSEVHPERLKKSFNVNAFGPVNMVRTFLPMLVASGGRVINISSESVKFPGAFQPYQPSKMALEGLHRTLRQELYLKGVKMVAVRPGAIDTEMTASVARLGNPVKNSIYEREFGVFASEASRFVGRKITPGKVAALIYRAATVKNPRYYCHINHSMLLTALAMLPEKMMDRLIRWLYQKKE